MTSLLTADRWIYGNLSLDATITAAVGTRIYADLAPAGAANPYIIFSQQSSNTIQVLGAESIAYDQTYLIKAVIAGGSYASLETVLNRIRALINGASGTVTNGFVAGARELSEIRYHELVDGVEYRHAGIIFRITTQ